MMDCVLTVVANPALAGLDDSTAATARSALTGRGATVGDPDGLAPRVALDLPFDGLAADRAQAAAADALAGAAVDICAQPAAGRRKALLVADMDSTVIEHETLDEMARLAGLADRVVPITDRAMNGEMNFEDALRARVALFAGRSADLITEALRATPPSPGAATLVRTMARSGALCVLVSGGFTAFTHKIRSLLGFHLAEGNTLVVEDGKLTGAVGEPIVGKERKLAALEEHASARGLTAADAVAIGDGANDLPMLLAAGLGIAYRAKPTVRDAVRIRIDHADLTAPLYFQGYRQHELAPA